MSTKLSTTIVEGVTLFGKHFGKVTEKDKKKAENSILSNKKTTDKKLSKLAKSASDNEHYKNVTGGEVSKKLKDKVDSSFNKYTAQDKKLLDVVDKKEKLEKKEDKQRDEGLNKTAKKIISNPKFALKQDPKTMSPDLKEKINAIKIERKKEDVEKKKKVEKPVEVEKKPKVDPVDPAAERNSKLKEIYQSTSKSKE
jgi:hypothetical protein